MYDDRGDDDDRFHESAAEDAPQLPTQEYVVSWDGPEAGKRAYQTWATRENAEAHAARKQAAGLNPELYYEGDIDDALAQHRLETQP